MKKPHIWVLLGIMALGAFLRFYLITEIPPGLYPDEAMNGNNALEALATGRFKVFYPENNGREGLFINIQALSLAAFGNTPWALRIVSAFFGTLTILGVYLVARELFRTMDERKSDFPREVGLPRSEVIALFSAFFIAASYWHLNFSRIGFRAIMVPFFACFGIYFLLKGLRRGSVSALTLAGIFTGLGLYTYIAFRFMAPVFLVPLAWYLIKRKKDSEGKSDFPREVGLPRLIHCAPCAVALFAFIAFVVALPLGIYFLQHPREITNRAGEISVFAAASPLAGLGKSALLHVGMLFWQGDCNWRHNFNCAPALNPLVAGFLLIGIISLWRLSLHSWKKWLIYLWVVFMALPGVLTREGIPHALRAIGMIPPLMILAGLGADRVRLGITAWIEKQRARYPQRRGQLSRIRYEMLVLFALALFLIPLATHRAYFLGWSAHPKTYEAFDTGSLHVGTYLAALPRDTKKYVVVNTLGVPVRGIPMPSQTVMFVTDTFRDESRQKKNLSYITRKEIDQITAALETPTVITFIDGSDRALIRDIQKKYPGLQVKVPGDFMMLQNY